jgi:hypothetical protein
MNRPSLTWLVAAVALCGSGIWQSAPCEAAKAAKPPKKPVAEPTRDLLTEFLPGPLAGVEEIVFAVRPVVGEHWYANFSYYASNDTKAYFRNGGVLYREGGKLCRFNLRSGKRTTILDDPKGGIRDPQVDYDGRKILFSYRRAESQHYHLYEIQLDGSGLRQLTDGDYDDIEPAYLPDGNIVFVSSRCKRWVNCWLTQVAVLYRCDADGRNIVPLSSNNEHDNTPWPLPDGRILYTRWEYVDRSQVHYHHLWTVNPDGTAQMVYFGNLNPGVVMIDAKPIPGVDKVVASFSPGHGRPEHAGAVTVIDPKAGPDDAARVRPISRTDNYRDPWAFSEKCFLAARDSALVLLDDQGVTQEIFRLSPDEIAAKLMCHEPRPVCPRPREPALAPRSDPAQPTGRLMLADVTNGRNMAGVKRGEVKKLLVLESLPKPINFTGGMEPLSYGGTFTLERILGTVPVEPDGSAYFQVPALRSVFFVALDENDLSVKRMQSFVTVQPGETASCVGCHEQRTKSPAFAAEHVLAMGREPSRIEPLADVPDVLDFPRDIQPILDRHCLACHDFGKREGNLILSGDRGPMFSHSYFALTAHSQVSDGRNRPQSNYPPRSLGSGASPLMKMLEPTHYLVKLSPQEKKTVRLWIDTGAPYPGTYAALGCGMIGGYTQNQLDRQDTTWPSTQAAMAAMKRRCDGCHTGERTLPQSVSDNLGRPPWVGMAPTDPRRRFARHLLYNLTRPEKSPLLLAPLSPQAGGWGACRQIAKKGPRPSAGASPLFADTKMGAVSAPPATVFAATNDADYQLILTAIAAAKSQLDEIKRFDMPGFRPRPEWVREMKRYGILPSELTAVEPLDVYAVERQYWKSFWYRPMQP